MHSVSSFRVQRMLTPQTHRDLQAELLPRIEALLFGHPSAGAAIRQELEQLFASHIGFAHACAVHSGTMALLLALRACQVAPGDEVITVGNTDVSTLAAIRHAGANPVLCDVQASDYTMNVDQVVDLISPRTSAVMPVDLHGHPTDVRRLRAIADQYGLRIVEDAALALGSRDYDRPVGSFADATVFSFAPVKPLGSLANGAMMVTNDPQIAERMHLLCHYGHDPHPTADISRGQSHIAEGYNVPLDPFQAALVMTKLPYLDAWTARRRAIAEAYAAALASTPAIGPGFRAESQPTFRSYTIRVPDQRRAYEHLRAAGIEIVLHYTPPVHQQPVYQALYADIEPLPITEQLANEIVSLPVAPEMTDAQVELVLQSLRTIPGRE